MCRPWNLGLLLFCWLTNPTYFSRLPIQKIIKLSFIFLIMIFDYLGNLKARLNSVSKIWASRLRSKFIYIAAHFFMLQQIPEKVMWIQPSGLCHRKWMLFILSKFKGNNNLESNWLISREWHLQVMLVQRVLIIWRF